MAARKYVSDYRLEKHILPNGKVESIPVYEGAYFTFVNPAEARRLRKLLLVTCIAVFALLIPLFLDNTRLGRTIYVILPAAAALVPLYLLLASARRLGFSEDPFTREHRDGVIHINVHHSGGSDEDKLNGIELYLKNEDAFKNIANVTATGIK